MLCYPVLRSEIAKRGIKKKAIANKLGITYQTLRNKMDGTSSFTWDEICSINATFFPDMSKDDLFDKGEDDAVK